MLNKAAIITGASSGIGEATARRLAREGLRLTLSIHREDQLERVARLIRDEDHIPQDHLLLAPTDGREPGQIEAMVKASRCRWGQVDVLINNAGVCFDRMLVNMKSGNIHQEVETNLTAVIDLARAVLPGMLRPEKVADKIYQANRHPRRQIVLPFFYSFLAAGANLGPEIADFIVPLFILK
jgi:NADP-dependent 3-hydroxy acid dehydrogenase YdfG